MRAVLQRVTRASVAIDGTTVGAIGPGLVVLLGIAPGDGPRDSAWLAQKVATLRIFRDDADKMNRSVVEARGAALVVSQFTLYGDCRKGRRPSFVGAAPPDVAEPLYERFCGDLREGGLHVETGRFGAMMTVDLCNDGPVTLILDTEAPVE